MGETRKLAAILVADVVGYSRLAGADEDRILARLIAGRRQGLQQCDAAHELTSSIVPRGTSFHHLVELEFALFGC